MLRAVCDCRRGQTNHSTLNDFKQKNEEEEKRHRKRQRPHLRTFFRIFLFFILRLPLPSSSCAFLFAIAPCIKRLLTLSSLAIASWTSHKEAWLSCCVRNLRRIIQSITFYSCLLSAPHKDSPALLRDDDCVTSRNMKNIYPPATSNIHIYIVLYIKIVMPTTDDLTLPIIRPSL